MEKFASHVCISCKPDLTAIRDFMIPFSFTTTENSNIALHISLNYLIPASHKWSHEILSHKSYTILHHHTPWPSHALFYYYLFAILCILWVISTNTMHCNTHTHTHLIFISTTFIHKRTWFIVAVLITRFCMPRWYFSMEQNVHNNGNNNTHHWLIVVLFAFQCFVASSGQVCAVVWLYLAILGCTIICWPYK